MTIFDLVSQIKKVFAFEMSRVSPPACKLCAVSRNSLSVILKQSGKSFDYTFSEPCLKKTKCSAGVQGKKKSILQL